MVMRKVAKKKINGNVKTASQKAPAKVIQIRVQFDLMVSVGDSDERSFEEFRDDTIAALKDPDGTVAAKNVTTMSGYYLVNGKVCLPDDYDPKTQGFKPGAHPPLWAMSADEQKIAQRIEREKKLPEIARQPANLRTSKETTEYHELLKRDPEAAKQQRRSETRRVLEDLNENTEWGQQRKAALDAEEIEDVEDIEEVEDIEDEWDEDDVFDEDAADEVVNNSSGSVLARLRAAKVKSNK